MDGPSPHEVQEFIRENKIDDVAARALLEAGPSVQKGVLSRGTLSDCRNPSAVCLARIRESRQAGQQSSSSANREGASVAEDVRSSSVETTWTLEQKLRSAQRRPPHSVQSLIAGISTIVKTQVPL